MTSQEAKEDSWILACRVAKSWPTVITYERNVHLVY